MAMFDVGSLRCGEVFNKFEMFSRMNLFTTSRSFCVSVRSQASSRRRISLEDCGESIRDLLPGKINAVSNQLTEQVKVTPIPQLVNPGPVSEVIQPDLLQGSKEWLDLRKNRVTASAFGNVLGFWNGRRAEVWEEKIGLKEPFAGNVATRWGSSQELAAVEKYKEITGNGVEHVAFKIYYAGDEYYSWLGASPDGLISYKAEGEKQAGDVEQVGILEVKCPHNKGKPELGSPWQSVPHYYMPQAQGLLEIFDRKSMDFYVWTVNGSSVFRIEREPEYWGLMFRIMAEFWWGNVVPAKFALSRGKSQAEVEVFRPTQDHPSKEQIVDFSRQLARNSALIWRENRGLVQKY